MNTENDFRFTENIDRNGALWNKLSEKQKEELSIAFVESFNEDNLLSHEEVKQNLQKSLRT